MNARERFIETLTFGTPDKIPFIPGGARESTVKNWRNQGLPAGVDYYDYLCEKIGLNSAETRTVIKKPAVSFDMMPQFEEKVLEHKNGHLIVQDWKGNICEISDTFDVSYLKGAKDFVTRSWIKCPVENRKDWEDMMRRYNVNEPGRFGAAFEEQCKTFSHPNRTFVTSVSVNGPFWQLREWLGFEGLCMMLLDDPVLIREMVDYWIDFISATLKRVTSRMPLDHVLINEDMAYKAKPMISPAMVREFIQPAYDRWVPEIKSSGCKVIELDSDGFIGDLIPIWMESGVTSCSPIEVAAGCEINDFRGAFGKKMSFLGGVDKREMAKGGQYIRKEMKRLSPVIKDGGYIPGCDHGVPSDVAWPEFVEYSELLAAECGW